MEQQFNNFQGVSHFVVIPANHFHKVVIQSDTGLYEGRSSHWDSSGVRAAAPRRKKPEDRKVINEEGITLGRGDRVAHDKFGEGTIVNIDGHKLDIAFDRGGHKRVMDSFVEKC